MEKRAIFSRNTCYTKTFDLFRFLTFRGGMAAKKNNKNTTNNQTKKEALKEAALTSNGDDIIVPSPLTKIADLRPGWIGDCCFRVIEESKEEEEEEDEDEKRRKQTQQHMNASSSSKQHQNHRRFREFLVGDVSGKIKFRCSEKREGESSSRLYSVISSSSLVVVVVLSFWILRRADGQTDTNRKRELIRAFESSERYFSSQLTPVLSLSLFLFQYHITSQIILSRSFKTKRSVPFKKRENRNDQRPDATDDG